MFRHDRGGTASSAVSLERLLGQTASVAYRQYFTRLQRVVQLGHLPKEVARKLVARLYEQQASQILSALVVVCFGFVCYRGTGSGWYLVGMAYSAVVGIWRYAQMAAYRRRGREGDPVHWAFWNLVSGWATAVGWAAWAVVVPFEPEPVIVAITLGFHAGLTSGGAFRNGAVPAVANGQIIIASAPLCVACLVATSPYYHFYAIVVVLYSLAAWGMTKAVHRQTCEMLLQEQEATALAAELALLNDYLSEQAITDPLTGLLNRRALDIAVTREWRNARRENHPLSVLMFDLDWFKAYNDHYGHQAGDQCLREVASVLKVALRRPGDVVARYGGEEFIAVLPSVDVRGAAMVASSVSAELASRMLAHAMAPPGLVTISIGIAGSVGSEIDSVTQLIEQADIALFVAKRRGRQQIVVYDELEASEAVSVLAS